MYVVQSGSVVKMNPKIDMIRGVVKKEHPNIHYFSCDVFFFFWSFWISLWFILDWFGYRHPIMSYDQNCNIEMIEGLNVRFKKKIKKKSGYDKI